MTMPVTFPEVLEEHASGRTREIYGEIKTTFGTSIVSFVWRGLAVYPDYFDAMWTQLRRNAASRYLADKANDARAMAVIPDGRQDLRDRLRAAGAGDRIDDLRAIVDAYASVNPNLLILVAALEEGSHAIVGGHGLMPDPVSRGMRDAPSALPMVRLDDVGPEVAMVLEEVQASHGWHGIPSVYRTIAQWPAVLRVVWTEVLQPSLRTPAATLAANDLYWFSIAAARYLPYPVDLSHRRLEALGVSKAHTEEIRVKLGLFHRLIPEVMVEIARVQVALDGVNAALGRAAAR